jgi:hypothetical protein
MRYNHYMMKIELSLLGLVSAAYLVMAILSGADVALNGIEIDASITSSHASVSIHPTFLIWTESELFYRICGAGMAYGNVAIFSMRYKNEIENAGLSFNRIIEHEKRHLEQFRALGILAWPAKWFLPIEPTHVDWDNPFVELEEMWEPPQWWPFQWTFLRLYIG